MEISNPPIFKKKTFTCPHCDEGTQHVFKDLYINLEPNLGYAISTCVICNELILWKGSVIRSSDGLIVGYGSVVYPRKSPVPSPDENMPASVKKIYKDAAEIYPISAPAAAAMLRLALETLLKEEDFKGVNLNDAIAKAVEAGVDDHVQKAMDSIRIIGNEGVHPGEIDLNDTPEIVSPLFVFINRLVYDLLTWPRKVSEVYDQLPDSKITAIKKRDKKS